MKKAFVQKNVQVLDVRTPGEYQSVHLKNAFLANWNNEKEFQERAKALDKVNLFTLTASLAQEVMLQCKG